MADALQIKGLKKSYGNIPVLKGIDLSVQQGEIFALLGVNGAGKTTALECIEGLRTYDNGVITIHGKIGIQLQSVSLQAFIKPLEAVNLFSKWNKNNEKFVRMPFVYTMYRMGVKKHMAKNFPPEAWKTEWVRCDGKEIHFNLHSCLYYDVCVKYDCPELCTIFCENDNIAFSGLLPKIRFERAGTIGDGANYCDFHFIKMKRKGKYQK